MKKQKEYKNFIVHGDIIYCTSPTTFRFDPDSYLVVRNGCCIGIYDKIPNFCDADYCDAQGEPQFELYDYAGQMIIPGMVDLHIHAPQFHNRGFGMDEPLLDWLSQYTFPEEQNYTTFFYDPTKAYADFVESLKMSPTTRAAIFGTSDYLSTANLAMMMDNTGLISKVGLVAMNQNCPEPLKISPHQYADNLCKLSTLMYNQLSYRTQSIITPRFAISCDTAMLEALHHLAENTLLPVQTHLCENLDEIETVKQLHPGYKNYADVYRSNGLFGNYASAIMAHCIHCTEEEKRMLEEFPHVFVAHCPESNINLTSGVAPIAEYLRRGISVGMGTDVAAGSSDNMFRQVMFAIQASKMRAHFTGDPSAQLSLEQAFYIATAGGGMFFGFGTGTFNDGAAADILVVTDPEPSASHCTYLPSRLERLMYLGDSSHIVAKFVDGVKIF